MKYGIRMPDLGKSISAKLSVNRMLRQQLGFGKGLLPNRKKAKYNKKYSKTVHRLEDMKGQSFNTQSERIVSIQKILKKQGLYKDKLTGILDSKTIKAIKEFQKKSGLNATGLLDSKTLFKLNKKESEKNKK